MQVDRRSFLYAGAAGAAAILAAPRLVVANAMIDQRFVFIIQRGAADGMSMIPPIGDPRFEEMRGSLAAEARRGAKLDDLFSLHPALVETGRLYGAKEAIFAHAVASPYRERSHFDGQNVLETGSQRAYALDDGWVNRLLSLLPADRNGAVALAATIPLGLRGQNQVNSYAPSGLPQASDDLLNRVSSLYEEDHYLHPLWTTAMQTKLITADFPASKRQSATATGTLAARLLTGQHGARVAMIDTGGWDTHSAQNGRMESQLKGLDALIAALKAGLGAAWATTLVLVATEFGRTVRPNGTKGTDHGTASSAMLLGGVVSGARVLADWPGLSAGALYQDRDLRPTLDLDLLIANALSQHFAIDLGLITRILFPTAPVTTRIDGLIS